MSNDVYLTARAWLSAGQRAGADLKLTVICPATDKVRSLVSHRSPSSISPADPPHLVKDIAKYSEQSYKLIRETPELYQAVVEPYIDSVPPAKLQWQVT